MVMLSNHEIEAMHVKIVRSIGLYCGLSDPARDVLIDPDSLDALVFAPPGCTRGDRRRIRTSGVSLSRVRVMRADHRERQAIEAAFALGGLNAACAVELAAGASRWRQ